MSELTEVEFLELRIDSEEAVNWDWRGRHLNDLFQRGETFGQARERILSKNLFNNYPSIIVELDTSRPFIEPMNMSPRFWHEGNNLFIYPLIFGFREAVLPYSAANLYINFQISPNLYSADYFRSLPEMTDEKIIRFLSKYPIEVTDGAVTSGRHRACALLGRLLKGGSYIPISVIRR